MVSQIFQSSVVQGKMVKKWVDAQLSCSGKEPDCLDTLKEWADPKKWFDPNPAPLLPLGFRWCHRSRRSQRRHL